MAPRAKKRAAVGADSAALALGAGREYAFSHYHRCHCPICYAPICAGEPSDVQTRALNVDIMARVKTAWDGLMS